jgi:hypothetical protein
MLPIRLRYRVGWGAHVVAARFALTLVNPFAPSTPRELSDLHGLDNVHAERN